MDWEPEIKDSGYLPETIMCKRVEENCFLEYTY